MAELRLEGIDLDGPDGGPVFRNLGLELAAGDSLLVQGGTGFARGQFLKLAAGLLAPQAGSVWINGCRLWPGEGLSGCVPRPRTGLCFARGGLVSNMSLRDNLELPALASTERSSGEIRATCGDLLSRFGLLPLAGLRPFALDARTRKLANLIRIRLLEPDLVFLDDPLEELSPGDLAEIETWIRGWAEDATRILVITAFEEDFSSPGLKRRAVLQGGKLEGRA